jgi:hypothetical protein
VNRWASPVLDGRGSQVLAAARSQGPVRLIATARDALACRPARQWRQVLRDASQSDFDQVPLTGEDGLRIESMFVRGQGRVPLVANMFMAADAPLLAFVQTADAQRFRLLVAEDEVVGMVTLSDLQRLPVYLLLFSLLIAVEVLLVEWIRKACGPNPDAWLAHLTRGQREMIDQHWRNAVRDNLAIDRLECASFGHEIAAVRALGLFKRGEATEAHLLALRDLRNRVYHAMKFAPSAEDALMVSAQAGSAQDLAAWLLQRFNEDTPA